MGKPLVRRVELVLFLEDLSRRVAEQPHAFISRGAAGERNEHHGGESRRQDRRELQSDHGRVPFIGRTLLH